MKPNEFLRDEASQENIHVCIEGECPLCDDEDSPVIPKVPPNIPNKEE